MNLEKGMKVKNIDLPFLKEELLKHGFVIKEE